MQPYEELEQKFCEWASVSNAVACASGTAALHLAFETLPLPKGSQIVMPEFTMIACARAVAAAGLQPVFVDCTDDLLLDPRQLPDRLTDTTAALLAVHIYGRRCPMIEIVQWLQEAGVEFLVEDLAEIHGIGPHRRADAACWSFYRNKIVCGEEGGLVAFSAGLPGAGYRELALDLRTLGQAVQTNFLHRPRVWNHRLSNAQAKLILESLVRYEANAVKRRQIEKWYDERVPKDWHMPKRDAVWVYDLRLRGRRDGIDGLVKALNKEGVAARCSFKPMSQQQEFLGHYRHLNAYRLSREVFYLLVSPDLTEADVERSVQLLKSLV